MRFVREVLSWVLSVFLGLVFVHWSLIPFIGAPSFGPLLFTAPGDHSFAMYIQDALSLPWIEPDGRYSFAGGLIITVMCLMVRPFRRFGAVLSVVLCGVLVGFQAAEIVPMDLPVSGENGSDDNGAQFILSTTCMIGAALLFVVTPPGKRKSL